MKLGGSNGHGGLSVAPPRFRFLVLEDDREARWALARTLEEMGHAVEAVETGEQALAMVSRFSPEVALLDVHGPGLDGVSVLKRALSLKPTLVAVMMSGTSTVPTAVEAMKSGAVDFLVKPVGPDALEDAVRKALTVATVRQRLAKCHEGSGKGPVFICDAPACQDLRDTLRRLSTSKATTVLIEGESGVGKEVIARLVHEQSSRAQAPFLQLNCAALPEHLVESELFGHERGAFTDAKSQKRGLFESAQGGSILLDEIGELPPGGQAKLLRLLEEKTFRHVGGVVELKADVRIVAATNVDLEKRVREGRFRPDLYFRLNVVKISVPPLRLRREDIPALCAHFITRISQELGRPAVGLSPRALQLLERWHWPGNVRELRNAIERALVLHQDATELRPEHLPLELSVAPASSAASPGPAEGAESLFDAERRLIERSMERARGNQSEAARLLGITRHTLRYRLKKFGMM